MAAVARIELAAPRQRLCIIAWPGTESTRSPPEWAKLLSERRKFEIADGRWATLALKFKRINVLPPSARLNTVRRQRLIRLKAEIELLEQ